MQHVRARFSGANQLQCAKQGCACEAILAKQAFCCRRAHQFFPTTDPPHTCKVQAIPGPNFCITGPLGKKGVGCYGLASFRSVVLFSTKILGHCINCSATRQVKIKNPAFLTVLDTYPLSPPGPNGADTLRFSTCMSNDRGRSCPQPTVVSGFNRLQKKKPEKEKMLVASDWPTVHGAVNCPSCRAGTIIAHPIPTTNFLAHLGSPRAQLWRAQR